MSYILDALKKSEQERGKGDIPNVQTVHSSSLNYGNKKNTYWPYILITAVLLNFIAISYFIFNKEKTVVSNSAHAPESSLSVSASKEEPELITKKNLENNSESKIIHSKKIITSNKNSNVRSITKPTQKQSQKKAQQNTNNMVISDYYELSDSVKNRLPAIIVSAHVFSKNPLQRSIVINNNFMEEGEYVSKELMLHEITRDGAIFDFEGNLINYSVVSKWQ